MKSDVMNSITVLLGFFGFKYERVGALQGKMGNSTTKLWVFFLVKSIFPEFYNIENFIDPIHIFPKKNASANFFLLLLPKYNLVKIKRNVLLLKKGEIPF